MVPLLEYRYAHVVDSFTLLPVTFGNFAFCPHALPFAIVSHVDALLPTVTDVHYWFTDFTFPLRFVHTTTTLRFSAYAPLHHAFTPRCSTFTLHFGSFTFDLLRGVDLRVPEHVRYTLCLDLIWTHYLYILRSTGVDFALHFRSPFSRCRLILPVIYRYTTTLSPHTTRDLHLCTLLHCRWNSHSLYCPICYAVTIVTHLPALLPRYAAFAITVTSLNLGGRTAIYLSPFHTCVCSYRSRLLRYVHTG